MVVIDPDAIAADEREAENLRAVAALAAQFYDACRCAGLPDVLTVALVRDWHHAYITQGVVWEEDGTNDGP